MENLFLFDFQNTKGTIWNNKKCKQKTARTEGVTFSICVLDFASVQYG